MGMGTGTGRTRTRQNFSGRVWVPFFEAPWVWVRVRVHFAPMPMGIGWVCPWAQLRLGLVLVLDSPDAKWRLCAMFHCNG